ncbi:MAG: hypothetical protein KC729_09370 [Candidatus Eisenbacteria bacterium]|uniref:Uncharacterized protein n=1 Tax=Eiseniibacteriota bacterium TaxID=2212470 RepID=A0A956LYE3_UNCEI|nr:hypothetical protein [Candidatus Eisenbacteria bacterium]
MSDSERPRPRSSRKHFRAGDAEALRELRSLLLHQHKVLMEMARREWERAEGRVAGPGELLHLLMEDPALAWLRLLSSKVARLDAILDDPEDGQAETLVAEVDGLILERGPEEAEFQIRYESALASSADATLLHVQLAHALRKVRGPLPLLDPA